MKKFTLSLPVFLHCLLCSFSLLPAVAQTPSVISGPACIDASANSVTYTLVTNSNSTTYGYRWYTRGDIEIVSTNGNKVTIRSVNKRTGTQPGYAKGRLFVSHRNVDSDPCGPFLAQLDIYKEFNLKTRPGGAVLIGPACVAPGDTVAYSIDPVLSRNLDDEIGLDHYKWSFPEGWRPYYYSGDSTSVTLIAGSSVASGVTVEVGRCNFGNADKRISLGLFQKAGKPLFVQKPQCLATDVRTVTVSVRQVGGVSYRWTKPSNWTITKSGVANDENFITLNIDGNPGQIIVEAGVPGSGKCPSDTASFVLTRSLGADSYVSGEACLAAQSGGVRTYTLVNAPLNSSFAWTLPAGWTFANADSTAQSVQVNPGPGGGTIGVSVKGSSCGNDLKFLSVQQQPARPLALAGADCLTPHSTGNVYSIQPVAGATSYTWTLSGGLASSSILVNGGTSIAVNAGATGGTVSVVANNGSCAGLPLAKAVSLAPATPAGITPAKSCINRDSSDEITFSVVSPVSGQAYEWQPIYPVAAPGTAAPSWTVKTGTSASGPSITFVTNGAPGAYAVQARAVKAGCGTSDWVTSATVNAMPAISVSMQSINDPETGQKIGDLLVTVGMPGATYQWYRNGLLLAGETGRTLNLDVFTGAKTTFCVVASKDGCGTNSACMETEFTNTLSGARMSTAQTTEPDLSSQVSVYPNPTTDGEFTLQLPEFKGEARVVLKSLHGQVLYSGPVSKAKSKLSAGKLTSGLYLLQVTLNGKTVTKKVQFQK